MASSTGPALHIGEAEGVIAFVMNRAKLLGSRTFQIPIDELRPFLVGATDENHILNRIRWKMKDQFKEAKIQVKMINRDYEFILDETLDISNTTNRHTMNDRQRVNTSTKFEEPFIAPTWFPDLMDALECGDKPILVGPKGCGKSRAAEEAMSRFGLPTKRFALGEYRDPADLIGSKEIVVKDGVSVTEFCPGPLLKALEAGTGVIIDEFDMGTPRMMASLNRVLEKGISITLETDGIERTFHPHPDSMIAVTANTWGQGDDSGHYSGALKQNSATWDRLRPRMNCEYDYVIERKLVSRHLPPKVVDALYSGEAGPKKRGIVLLIREAIANPTNPLEDIFGMRSILWFAQRWPVYGWHKGWYYLLNEFKEENREAVSKIVTNRMGTEYVPSRNDFDSDAADYIPNLVKKIVNSGSGIIN